MHTWWHDALRSKVVCRAVCGHRSDGSKAPKQQAVQEDAVQAGVGIGLWMRGCDASMWGARTSTAWSSALQHASRCVPDETVCCYASKTGSHCTVALQQSYTSCDNGK